MTQQTLSDVLNDLAGGRAAALAQNIVAASAVREEDFFIEADGIFASLNRHYLDARARHDDARREHGADSPMADIAADALDSAWCAMQTRLMELRANGDLMRSVQSKMREAALEEEREKQAEQDRHALNFFYRIETARVIAERNKTPAIYEWFAILIIAHRFLRLPFPAMGVPEQRMAA